MGQFLSGPCTLVETEECSGDNMRVCVGAMQGWRVNMEDSHIALIGLKENEIVHPHSSLFAVFDGHGGKEVAIFAETKFEEILLGLPEYKEGKYEDALRIAFHRVDELLEDLEYDDILKTYKKLPNPVAYALDVQQKPIPSVEKIARNIKFQTKLMRRLGLTDDPLNCLPKPNQVMSPPQSFKKVPISPRSPDTDTAVVTSPAPAATEESEEQMRSHRDTEVDVTRENLKELTVEEKAELDIPPAWTVAPPSSSTPDSSSSSGGESEGEATLAPIFVPENTAVLLSDPTLTEPEKPKKPQVCHLVNHRIMAGCTAVVTLKIGNMLYVANAGDSRAVLCTGDGSVCELSTDHKPQDDTEKNRVEAAGGFVNAMGRINGNLNLSRSLGDLKYKQNKSIPPEAQIITAEPDLVKYEIQPDDKFLILGCDGIWDCLTSQQACDIVRERLEAGLTPSEIVPIVLEGIVARDTFSSKGIGTDNMTLLIVQFLKESDGAVKPSTEPQTSS